MVDQATTNISIYENIKQMSQTHKKWVNKPRPALINTKKFQPLSTHDISVVSDRKNTVTSNN